ncbi:alpha/beta fold hydrolase [Nocardioidaceae bacterium]|nr:alpha/beta fold hydrolase [Nocardioidaceae bacterium]
MDLIPKPDQVVSAASNVAHKLLYGGLADTRPMPRTLIDDGRLREVYHYRPQSGVRSVGDPVLLVTPLAAPSICFDLRRGCSLVEHLVKGGRPTYLVEYGEVAFKDRDLGMEHWVDEVVPAAIRAVHKHAGRRPVHLVGWSLGGIFAALVAAEAEDLPIASLTVVGSPFDVSQVPLIAPLRPLIVAARGRGPVTPLYRLLGGAPKPLVKKAFQLSSVHKVITKPLALALNLDDREFLAQIEAVDRFTDHMIAYPGRSFGQLYHHFIRGNQLKRGRMRIGGRSVDVAAVTAPTLVFAGGNDSIAPVRSVRHLVDLLTGAAEVRFEVVPGGHLGMITGRESRSTTWVILDEWLDAHQSVQKTTPAQPTPAERVDRRTVAKARSTEVEPMPDRGKIGSNPTRRYSSAGSRGLAR